MEIYGICKECKDKEELEVIEAMVLAKPLLFNKLAINENRHTLNDLLSTKIIYTSIIIDPRQNNAKKYVNYTLNSKQYIRGENLAIIMIYKMIDVPLQTCYYIKSSKTNVNFLVSEINFIKLMLRKCNFDY